MAGSVITQSADVSSLLSDLFPFCSSPLALQLVQFIQHRIKPIETFQSVVQAGSRARWTGKTRKVPPVTRAEQRSA